MSYDFLNEKVASNIVGTFVNHKDDEFTKCLESLSEEFKTRWGFNIWQARNFVEAMGRPDMASDYKNLLLGDVLEESASNEWLNEQSAKIEQLFENTMDEIVSEATVAELHPIVAYTPPILKKNYYESISNQIMQTQVPDAPIIRVSFERAFLRDRAGNKYYIPDVFYDNSYKAVMDEARGDDIRKKLDAKLADNPTLLQLPLVNFNVLENCGYTLANRDELDYDFAVVAVKAKKADAIYRVPLKLNPDFDPTQIEDVTTNPKYVADPDHAAYVAGQADQATLTDTDGSLVEGFNFEPNFAAQNTIYGVAKVPGFACTAPSQVVKDAAGVEYPGVVYLAGGEPVSVDYPIFGQVDTHYGTVTVSCPSQNVTEVRLGGHISNQNNNKMVDIDYENTPVEWKIEEREYLNSGITLKKIKDTKALNHIDITAKIIADMSTSLSQFEDADTLDFCDQSFNKWKNKKDLPFGYGNHVNKGSFVEEAVFSAIPQTGIMAMQPQWVDTMLKYTLERLLIQLNKKLYNKQIGYVLYGNSANISLLRNDIKWTVSNDTKVGGVQLEYKFGLLQGTDFKVSVVSSEKVPEEAGIRILAYPLSNETITFKHFKYSFNIENNYRNSATPLIPNIMATHRYKTIELMPVQGKINIINNGFGNTNPLGIVQGPNGYQN